MVNINKPPRDSRICSFLGQDQYSPYSSLYSGNIYLYNQHLCPPANLSITTVSLLRSYTRGEGRAQTLSVWPWAGVLMRNRGVFQISSSQISLNPTARLNQLMLLTTRLSFQSSLSVQWNGVVGLLWRSWKS